MLRFDIRPVRRRVAPKAGAAGHAVRSVEQLTELVGRVPLKDLVRETTDLVERLCIEAALKVTGDNRASAAEILGRQPAEPLLKLHRFGCSTKAKRSSSDRDPRRPNCAKPRMTVKNIGHLFVSTLSSASWHGPHQRRPRAAQADHLVRADVGLRLRRHLRPASAGQGRWPLVVAGVLLAGPLVCATSQAANDWYDRHVDAINEPDRPIPSGRIPGRWGLHIALAWTALSLAVAAALGPWGFAAIIWAGARLGLLARRRFGSSATAGGATRRRRLLRGPALVHRRRRAGGRRCRMAGAAGWRRSTASAPIGIMTLNDFKSVEGDRRIGIARCPSRSGVERAARVACAFMAPAAGRGRRAAAGLGRGPARGGDRRVLLLAQLALMRVLLQDPREQAPWYNATGTTLYVLGMLVGAFALRPSAGAAA